MKFFVIILQRLVSFERVLAVYDSKCEERMLSWGDQQQAVVLKWQSALILALEPAS